MPIRRGCIWLSICFGFQFDALAQVSFGGVTDISVGLAHSCALTTAGGVKCWGKNDRGQLGTGDKTDRNVATDVWSLTSGVTAISVGDDFTCALTDKGAVKCWGNGRPVAYDYPGMASDVAAISVGLDSSLCAITSARILKCSQGSNIPSTTCLSNSEVVRTATGEFLANVASVSLSRATFIGQHACVVTNGGAVKCWGSNDYGQASGSICSDIAEPSGFPLSQAVDVSVGPEYSCALLSDGRVKCWGMNRFGELGRGSRTEKERPGVVEGIVDAVAMRAGILGGCAVRQGGGVACWGGGANGDGTRSVRPAPVSVLGLTGPARRIGAGHHSCAALTSGEANCWGNNSNGQLGVGVSEQYGLLANRVLMATTPTLGPNYTDIWWNAAESGWGIHLSHQGNVLFATLFVYDEAGRPLWLVMSNGAVQADGVTFKGDLYRTTGSPFSAEPFTPINASNVRRVGEMSVQMFFGGVSAALTYSVNDVSVTKTIQRQKFGSRSASCTPSTSGRGNLTNFQDLWWNPAEAGWGVNIAHQDNTLFATLFTYDGTGQGLWLVLSSATKQADGSYFGDLYQTTGTPFSAARFSPLTAANLTKVGAMRFTFSDGVNGTLIYSINGATVTKRIMRQEFGTPLPSCS